MAEAGMNKKDEVEALLPFLANDTLTGEERAEVEAAVAADADLAVQLRALRRIRKEVKAEPLDWSPGEMGLARLMRDIEAEAPVEAAPLVLDTPVAANDNRRARVWQIAAAVALAAFAAQSVFVWSGATGPDMELASGGSGPIGDGRLRVGFQGTATEADIRALLLAQDLVIIDGPSALGLYTLAVDEAATDDAIAALLANQRVVETVSIAE